MTFGELKRHITSLSAALYAEGIGRNDRVALALSSNGPEMATAFLAVIAVGTRYLSGKPLQDESELQACSGLSGTQVARHGRDVPPAGDGRQSACRVGFAVLNR